MRLSHFVLQVTAGGALLLCASSAAAAPRAYPIFIDKMKFGPLPAQLHKGDSIVWINRDFLRHSATAADHSFDVDLPAGAKGKTVFTKSGTIAFVCRYHPGMRGVLQVK
ncbi:MAG: cupredoxin domain-containing protein [Sphingomonas sp.]